MDDLISRQALLDVMEKEGIWGYFVQDWMKRDLEDIIKGLPRVGTEYIQDLIDEYIHEIDKLEEYRQEERSIGFGNAMATAKIGAYGRVVEDLRAILKEVER